MIFRSLDSEAPEDGGDEAEDEAEDRQPQYKVLVTLQQYNTDSDFRSRSSLITRPGLARAGS